MADDGDETRLRLRVVFGPDAMLGPGKADLLELIDELGSIAAAGRAMSMSYKRAWTLVEQMNDAFRHPLVDSSRGGTRGGGARLSDTGRDVLHRYRSLERRAAKAGAEDIAALRGMLGDMSGEK
ncbi:molybdate transport system regulatory protein [Tranquillimonas rosea]|uniref:Molybdate transport system regulatory protein n=1 Tax=Tranquillimonas rosea TaxID=641238 RepID=A0A1H9WJ57_9RHOB|nr:LysR family transcriptional regulator [Tranquillimonas rosea]SES33861.1 molybdate transport system regulatory protein [Tranquillimonas rosea]